MSILDELKRLDAQDQNNDIGGLLKYMTPYSGPETGTSFDHGSGAGPSTPLAASAGSATSAFDPQLMFAPPAAPSLAASDPMLAPQPSPLDILRGTAAGNASPPNRPPFIGASALPSADTTSTTPDTTSATAPPAAPSVSGSPDTTDDSVPAKPGDDGTRYLVNHEEEKEKLGDLQGKPGGQPPVDIDAKPGGSHVVLMFDPSKRALKEYAGPTPYPKEWATIHTPTATLFIPHTELSAIHDAIKQYALNPEDKRRAIDEWAEENVAHIRANRDTSLKLKDFVTNAARGTLPGSYFDELSAGLTSHLGGPLSYDEALAQSRAYNRAVDQDTGYFGTATRLASGLVTGLLLPEFKVAGVAANLAPQAWRALAQSPTGQAALNGIVRGAIHGAGNGETPAGRAGRAVEGAALGGTMRGGFRWLRQPIM